ncbi:MAG: hypothetical protein ABFQ95_01140 [Pseudomonadota bacterium]
MVRGHINTDTTLSTPVSETDGGTAQSSYVSGDILYASSTDTLSKLPKGVDDEVLTLVTGLPSWEAAGGGGSSDASNLKIWDDFTEITGNGSNGQQVSTHFIINESGVSTNTSSGIGSNQHPGIIEIQNGTGTPPDGVKIKNPGEIRVGGGSIDVEFLFKIETLSTSSVRYFLDIGLFGVGFDAEPTDGVYFYYSDNVNSGQWVGKSRNASTETTANSTVAANTNWTKLRVSINAAGTSASYFIDDVEMSNSPITTNLPPNSIDLFMTFGAVKVISTTERNFEIDYASMDIALTTER